MMKVLYGVTRPILPSVALGFWGHNGVIARSGVVVYCFDTVPILVMQNVSHVVHAEIVFLAGGLDRTRRCELSSC